MRLPCPRCCALDAFARVADELDRTTVRLSGQSGALARGARLHDKNGSAAARDQLFAKAGWRRATAHRGEELFRPEAIDRGLTHSFKNPENFFHLPKHGKTMLSLGMEVTLTKEPQALVKSKVQSGRYVDESDVIRDALRALEQRDEFESPVLEAALLEGVQSSHRPYSKRTLDRIRRGA